MGSLSPEMQLQLAVSCLRRVKGRSKRRALAAAADSEARQRPDFRADCEG